MSYAVKRIAVLTDRQGYEAVYVDGQLEARGSDLYMCDLVNASKGLTCVLEHVLVDMPEDAYTFPENLADAMAWADKEPTQ